MYYVEQSSSFEAVVEVGIAGLVGTIEVQIQDNLGATVFGPTSANIIESPAGSGAYQAVLTAPADLGQFVILWSEDGSFLEGHTSVDDLTVVAAGATDALPPVTPIEEGPGPQLGPCNAWTTEEDIAACCNVDVGSDFDLFTEVANAASQTLFELSIRQFPGTCDQTVRPCATDSPCGFQTLSRGHIVTSDFGWTGSSWGGLICGCTPTSFVTLAGYPVREIIEVKIDGVVLADTEYRLVDSKDLIRKNGENWPSCQRIDLDDTEEGTWSVRYTYGQNPPWIGQMAARELACELYKACAGGELGVECALPSGVTRLTRQNISIERNPFTSWGRVGGIWKTGLQQVDLFLNTYNPSGIRRRPVFVTPGRRFYPLSS